MTDHPETPTTLPPYRQAKEAFDRDYWTRTLTLAEGCVSRAADLADKTRKEVYDAARRLSLDLDAFRAPKGQP